MNATMARCAALGVLWCAAQAGAQEAFVVYDNFSSPLSPAYWTEYERTRVVFGGAMKIVDRQFGSVSSDAGTTGQSYGNDAA